MNTVFLFVWTGAEERALDVVRSHYPNSEITVLPKRELRESGWRGQIRFFSGLRGRALAVFCELPEDLQEPLLLKALSCLHRCQETAFVDASSAIAIFPRRRWLMLVPVLGWALVCDLAIFAASMLHCWWLARGTSRVAVLNREAASSRIAYLHPYPLNVTRVGGAMSHVRGIVGGLAAAGIYVDVFCGRELAVPARAIMRIPAKRKFFLFAESLQLSYNRRFAALVARALRNQPPLCVYQRHGRWVYSGVLLAARLRVPLVLEYNGSEVWMAAHWHPARFLPILRLCERAAIANASLIIVVSEPLKQELIQQGVSEDRVLMVPNGVDPQEFKPGCGGGERRQQWGFSSKHVVVGFLGTFSYWHGVKVLQDAIISLLAQPKWRDRLRFVLIGDGTLCSEMREALASHVASGQVLFTGPVAHHDVPAFLDASDILVSPHVPMPDGRPFFGSPTKLFEYMASAKSIVASRLDQIADVLEDGETALLVKPADPTKLAEAVATLAEDEMLRNRLGSAARQQAVAHHTWKSNVDRVLARISDTRGTLGCDVNALALSEAAERSRSR